MDHLPGIDRMTQVKAKQGRVYAIFENGEAVALVRASSQATAIRHIVRGRFEAVPADQDHLIALLGKGMKVEDAKEAEAETAASQPGGAITSVASSSGR